ncbi:MAG: hypothetical protein ACJ74Y_04735 [Bryobacteraceae bacterium]
MSPRVSAAPNFNFASVRDAAEVRTNSTTNTRSRTGRDSFSQVLRNTADDQRSSAAHHKGKFEKKDQKSEKDKSDGSTGASTASNDSRLSEKSSLPITFLFGLSSEPMESFDAQKSNSPNQLKLVDAAELSPKQAGDSSGQQANDYLLGGLLLMSPSDAANTAFSDGVVGKTQNLDANASGPELTEIGSNGNSVKGVAGSLSANALAFALRLGSGQAVQNSKAAGSVDPVSPVASEGTQPYAAVAKPDAVQAASGATLEDNAREHEESGSAQNIIDLSALRTAEPFEMSKAAEESPATSTAHMTPDPPTATTEPVRNVHMQLVGDDNRRVDVRLIDRGGELHVSVKSADPALTQNLQDHLPELTGRLEKQQMQTEVWVPKTAESTKAESGNTNGSLSDPNARSYSGNPDSRKDGRQERRPNWVDALENYS